MNEECSVYFYHADENVCDCHIHRDGNKILQSVCTLIFLNFLITSKPDDKLVSYKSFISYNELLHRNMYEEK